MALLFGHSLNVVWMHLLVLIFDSHVCTTSKHDLVTRLRAWTTFWRNNLRLIDPSLISYILVLLIVFFFLRSSIFSAERAFLNDRLDLKWHFLGFRSSHRRRSIKKGVLINFIKFTGKHLCQSLFNEVADLRPATL